MSIFYYWFVATGGGGLRGPLASPPPPPPPGHRLRYTWGNINEHKPFLRGLNRVSPVRRASYYVAAGRSGDVIHHTVRDRYT